MFRLFRSETDSTPAPEAAKVGGKGRPTPSRREAEAARRAAAKVPRNRKELARRQRTARAESSQKVRSAMKSGDERYFMARDRGPVRRYCRDFVDSRFSFIELMIPLLILTMVLGYSGSSQLAGIGNTILVGTMLLVVFDILMMRRRLRKQLETRFPDEDLKGTSYYAIMRSLQMRFMRLPKAKVKIGQELPETYR